MNENDQQQTSMRSETRRRGRRLVGPRLRILLVAVLGLFALLAVNAVYLVSVRLAGWLSGTTFENRLSLVMYLVHLVLGLLILVPALVFALVHLNSGWTRPNRLAKRVGYGLLATALVLLASGVVLLRLDGLPSINDPLLRSVAYWIHVISPLLAAWLFVLHRLAGPRLRWRIGLRWAVVALVATVLLLAWQARDPRHWGVVGNPEGERYFMPSLARTTSGEFIPARVLANDAYCRQCHPDVHERWSSSVHRFASFNNPAYLFSVRGTRTYAMQRDGDVRASRFCAGCHDPVPFFSGKFNDPNFDDVNDPTARSGITCTVCHAISNINSPRGNADYTIDEPVHYPFTFSDSRSLQWINRQLVKAKPLFHKKTFLKPLHRSPEFCGVCHKVHLPEDLNGYKWLRGQNHYDSFLLSGVSGHGVASFYYPERAEANCNGCHMPLRPSNDLGARHNDDSGDLSVHDHLFPSANTAVPLLAGMPNAEAVVREHQQFLDGVARVDLFGLRSDGSIDGELTAPLRPEIPVLEPGRSYLLEVVIRTLTLGHLLTQGTSDSNQLWLDVTVRSGNELIGRSGGMDEGGVVDPWSHFVNAYVLDRHGNRIDRRNAEDIFIALYDHQIPPGAADTVHYRLDLPAAITEPVEIEVALRYRKFDTTYMRYVYGAEYVNTLPVSTLATDRLVLPVTAAETTLGNDERGIVEWQRWHDYGIGLLRKTGRGELRQAEAAFQRLEELGRSEGPLNLARVYLREGRVAVEAPQALARAAQLEPRAWTLLWLSGLVNKANGNFEEAVSDLRQIVDGGFAQAAGRGFDFSKDYRLLNELAASTYETALRHRGERGRRRREGLLHEAGRWYEQVLLLDPENLQAHWGLQQVYSALGDTEQAAVHATEFARYKPDDNARDRAISNARRRDPAANHAAEGVVIYDLQRPGAFTGNGPQNG